MKIRIVSLSDITNNKLDGDYWVKRDLEAEFARRGYEVVSEGADLDFYLFGMYSYSYRMTAPQRFCWVYSHPDLVGKERWPEFAKQFEHIFVLSSTFLQGEKFEQDRHKSSVLLGASSKEFVPRIEEPAYDIVFVGSMRHGKRLETMKALIESGKYRICLVGAGWEKLGSLLNQVDYKGPYIDNHLLGSLFNEGKLSFYSAHEDMRQQGFVAVRILDIFRSSENLCISDENQGLEDIFRFIPTYKNSTELMSSLDWFLEHPTERKLLAGECRRDAEYHTFSDTIKEIEKWI